MRFPLLFRLSFLVLPLAWSIPLWSLVCRDDHPAFGLPFCDSTLELEERVNDYVSHIPVEYQIAMMSHPAAAYDPLGIPPYQWWSEGLHGPMEPCVEYKNRTNCPTSFPCPSGLGNSFNTTLFRRIGAAIGLEGRAISQLRNHDMAIGDGLTYWSPNVNLQRDPRWGRNQEGA
jgi:beta-D-xylosidase 4